MRMLPIFLALAVGLSACAKPVVHEKIRFVHAKPKPPKIIYKNRTSVGRNCPPLPRLADDATDAELTTYVTGLIAQYKECAK